jgi:hypothetical protein
LRGAIVVTHGHILTVFRLQSGFMQDSGPPEAAPENPIFDSRYANLEVLLRLCVKKSMDVPNKKSQK